MKEVWFATLKTFFKNTQTPSVIIHGIYVDVITINIIYSLFLWSFNHWGNIIAQVEHDNENKFTLSFENDKTYYLRHNIILFRTLHLVHALFIHSLTNHYLKFV